MKFSILKLIRFAVILAATPAALATTWYVNGVSGCDTNNCVLPTTACRTIGHAVALASSGDSVTVAAATYRENLTIGISLTVAGAGASTTVIDGGGVNTVVTVPSASAQVSLSGLTIKHGSASKGGGIFNGGTLTIRFSTVTENTVYGAGGGLYNTGTATIFESTISGNEALGTIVVCTGKVCYGYAHGGGIYNSGSLTSLDNTISQNKVDGIVTCFATCRIASEGGGIFNTAGSLTVTNSTIWSNLVSRGDGCQSCGVDGGGIYNDNGGNVSLSNSTISGNYMTPSINSEGGGIFNVYGSAARIQNTIIADNAVGNCVPTMTSNGYNLSSDNTCNFNGPGDMNNTKPMLGTLGSYGGPTQTMPLLSGSPAIDAGNPGGCTDGQGHLLKTDQRGMPRPDKEDAGGCDIGAYERQSD